MESEDNFEKENSSEISSADLANVCREILSEEDCVELEQMDFEEALGYSFTILIENGIDDPEGFLRSKGIIE